MSTEHSETTKLLRRNMVAILQDYFENKISNVYRENFNFQFEVPHEFAITIFKCECPKRIVLTVLDDKLQLFDHNYCLAPAIYDDIHYSDPEMFHKLLQLINLHEYN